MRHFKLCLTAAMVVLPPAPIVAPVFADTAPVIAARAEPGATLSLSPGPAGIRLDLGGQAGDYLAGQIAAGGAAFTARLVGADGQHLRSLSQGQPAVVSFRHLAEREGILLELLAAEGVTVSVTLETRLPEAAQTPPDVAYLSPRLAALARSLEAGGTTDAFWSGVALAGTPLVEPVAAVTTGLPLPDEGVSRQSVVTFLWRGARRNVRLFGGPSTDHDHLTRLGDSDVWFLSFVVPDDTRASYQLAPEVPDVPGNARARRVAILATARADPLNRSPWPADGPDRYNISSTFALPDAPAQPGTPPLPGAAPRLERFAFDSPALGNSREITLSLPPDFDPSDPRLVVALIFDGERAIREADMPRVLETLRLQGRLPPVAAVLIPALDSETRGRELPDNAVFADVLADDLLPAVAARLGIRPDPARTVLAGASYGGLGSSTIALRRPDVFGNVVSMSGSYWWAPPGYTGEGTPYVVQNVALGPQRPVRFFLSAGRFETGHQGAAGIRETSRELRDVLRLRGYETHWRLYSGGHDWLIWRGALPDGLIALFGQD